MGTNDGAVEKEQWRKEERKIMLVVGIILLLIGFLFGVPILWTAGLVLAVIGLILWIAEGAGASWGRRWY